MKEAFGPPFFLSKNEIVKVSTFQPEFCKFDKPQKTKHHELRSNC